jgi:hypothetical protein
MTPPEKPKKPRKKLKLKLRKPKTPKLPKAPEVNMPGNAGAKLPWLFVAILIAASVFLFTQYQSAQRKLDNATPAANKQVNDVIKNVSKITVVPVNEKPTVATVLNADKLKGQAFFDGTKNGDKILIYAKQNRGIIYRPSTNQIVNIGPVTATGATANPTN